MNAGELHHLARRLRELATEATKEPDEPRPSPGLLAVVEDISRYPDSALTDIVQRTSLAQSFVSKTVAQLRDANFLTTMADTKDRRRVRVRLADGVKSEILLPRAQKPLQQVLAERVQHLSATECQRAIELLDELHDLLKS